MMPPTSASFHSPTTKSFVSSRTVSCPQYHGCLHLGPCPASPLLPASVLPTSIHFPSRVYVVK
jgi:hypothetical protein